MKCKFFHEQDWREYKGEIITTSKTKWTIKSPGDTAPLGYTGLALKDHKFIELECYVIKFTRTTKDNTFTDHTAVPKGVVYII